MAIEKKLANGVLSKLDSAASTLERLASSGKISKDVAAKLVNELDAFADRFQVAAFGEKSLTTHKQKVAKVLNRESDEPYMDTFDNPNKVIKGDDDEEYMHTTGKTFHGKGADTYDNDNSSGVMDRPEHDVRDLSEHADKTQKQPSWPKGSAGKSTRQGSKATQTKTWAP